MRKEEEDVDARATLLSSADGHQERGFRIDRIRRSLGVTSRAVRFYEQSGLLPRLPRNLSGYRVVPESVLPRLRTILRARRLGFSLREVREILSAFDEGEEVCETTRQVLLRKRRHIQQAIQDLKALDLQIQGILKRCESSRSSASSICPAIEATPPAGTLALLKDSRKNQNVGKGGEEK